MRNSTLPLAAAALCLLLPACDGPTDPLAQEIFLQGTVADDDQAAHDVSLQDDGLLEFVLVQYQRPDEETGEIIDINGLLGFGVGRRPVPGEETDLLCVTSAPTGLAPGFPLVLRIDVTEFCVLLFDAGTIPDGTTASYAIRVRSTE